MARKQIPPLARGEFSLTACPLAGGDDSSRTRNAAAGPFPATAPQQALLRFIAGYIDAHGHSPTEDACARALGYKARSCIYRLIQSLEERGHIRRMPRNRRCIALLHAPAIPRAPDGAPLWFVPVSSLPVHGAGNASKGQQDHA